MNATALSVLISDPQLEKFLSNEKCLKIGDRLRGRVRDIRGNGRLLMDFGSFRALARVNFPVHLNETLDVIVLENKDQLRLELANPKNNAPLVINRGIGRFEVPAGSRPNGADIESIISSNTSLLKTARLPKEVLNALVKVSAHFAPLKLNGNILEIMGQLKTRTENSGLFFEKRLQQALMGLHRHVTGASAKNSFRLPGIKEILANDLKPVLWPLRRALTIAPDGRNSSSAQTRDTIRNMVEVLINRINAQQKSAVGRELLAESTKTPTRESTGATGAPKESLLRLPGLISQLIKKLESYHKANGGIIEKEVQGAFIKTSNSAKALLLKILPHFDEPGKMQDKGLLLRSISLNESFGARTANTPQGIIFQNITGWPAGLTAFLKTTQAKADAPLQFPSTFQQNRPSYATGHLTAPAANFTADPDPAAQSVETPIQAPGPSTASFATGQPRQPAQVQQPTAFQQNLQFNPARHLAEVIAQAKTSPPQSSETPSEEPGPSTASFATGQPRQPAQVQQPTAFQQNLQLNPARHLAEVIAHIKIGQDQSAPSAETPVGEPADSTTSSKTGQSKPHIELQHTAPFQQNQQANPIRHWINQITGTNIAPDPTGATSESPIEEKSVEPSSTLQTAQPKEPMEFAETNRMINRELMPALLTLERYLDTKDPRIDPAITGSREGLQRTVKELLTGLRNFHAQNRAGSEPTLEQVQVFSYDFFIKESDQRAKLKIYYPKKKKGKQGQCFKASLNLSMDKIGEIRTDFSLLKKSMNISFHVKDIEVKNIVEKNLHQIKPSLKKMVETLTIKVKVSETREKQAENDWSDIPGDNIIDVRI